MFLLPNRIRLTRLFVHHTISLSSLCKYIWRHWNYEMHVRYCQILSSVWVRLSIFSWLSIVQCMGPCVSRLPILLVMIEYIYFVLLSSSNRKYELLSIIRSWNNVMRCVSLYSYLLTDHPCIKTQLFHFSFYHTIIGLCCISQPPEQI